MAELQTPRAPRTRMSPGPSSAGLASSPRQGSPKSERVGHAATDVAGFLQAYDGDSSKAIEALLQERASLVRRHHTALTAATTKQPIVEAHRETTLAMRYHGTRQ
jgi:hypothetical protein